MTEHLPLTAFLPGSDYDVQVDEHGVWVNSECCGERMSRETAEKLRDAITAWLEATSWTEINQGWRAVVADQLAKRNDVIVRECGGDE